MVSCRYGSNFTEVTTSVAEESIGESEGKATKINALKYLQGKDEKIYFIIDSRSLFH